MRGMGHPADPARMATQKGPSLRGLPEGTDGATLADLVRLVPAAPRLRPACAAGCLRDGQPIVSLPAQAEEGDGPLVYTLAEGFSMNIRTSLGRASFVPLFTDREHLRRVWVRILGPYQHLLGLPTGSTLGRPQQQCCWRRTLRQSTGGTCGLTAGGTSASCSGRPGRTAGAPKRSATRVTAPHRRLALQGRWRRLRMRLSGLARALATGSWGSGTVRWL